jgi:hypothetical protein
MYPPGGPAYPMGAPSFWDAERTKERDRTKTGVLLLLVGALVGWLPFNIGLLGGLFSLIGAILVILGRKAFGAVHARNVVISIVLFFLGIGIVFAAIIVLVSVIAPGFISGPPPTQAAIQAALNNVLILGIVAGVVGGLSSVFFTFALQNQTGKILLVAAFVASIAIPVAILAVVGAELNEVVAAMFSGPGGAFDENAAQTALTSFQTRVANLELLRAIPSLIYAGAYYLAWKRINKGEIPAPPAAPGMPPAIQPR